MATEVILPRVDMDMEVGTVGKWFVEEGELVDKGQPLFEIETSKAAMEIEAPASGRLRAVAKTGDELPVGSVVGWIYAPDESFQDAPPAPALPAPASPATPEPPSRKQPPAIRESFQNGVVHTPNPGARATPLARRLAKDRGVDLRKLLGSGPKGRIQARDVPAIRELDVPTVRPDTTSGKAGSLHRVWLSRGDGAPIVLIHGFGADLNAWRGLAGMLSRVRPILALDLPGHGRSPLDGRAELEQIADAVEDALIEEGLLSFHLVGHSLGGGVAAKIAGRPSMAARSLTLISPAGLGPDINHAFFSGFLRARSQQSLAPWMRLLVHDEAALVPTLVETTLREREKLPILSSQETLTTSLFPDGTQSFSIRSVIQDIRIPIKVIFGLDDRIIPVQHATALPGVVALHLFARVGHMPHFEIRKEVAHLVDEAAAAGDQSFARAAG